VSNKAKKIIRRVLFAVIPGILVAGLVMGANVYYDLDTTSNRVTIGEETKIIGTTTAQNVVPASDVTYDLGTSGNRWANFYAATATIGNTITIDSNTISGSSATELTTDSGDISVTPAGDFNVDSGALFVDTSADAVGINTTDLGGSRFKIENPTSSSASTEDEYTDTGLISASSSADFDTSAGLVKMATTSAGGGGTCDGFTYSVQGSWGSKIDTTVRDYYTVGDSTATVNKDIYCDDENCVLKTDGASAPSGDICVATSSDVYMGALWDKQNASTSAEYGQYGDTLSSLGVVGGTHDGSLEVGDDNDTGPAGNDWLDKDYDSGSYTFPAMDACTSKGEGWKLPNIRELDSIRDQSNSSDPYTDLPNMQSANYWSSTELDSISAYYLYFYNGNVDNYGKFHSHYVRCVRRQ